MKKVVPIIVLLFLTIAVVTTVYLAKQRQDIQSNAAPATTLSFQIDNPVPDVGQQFSAAVKINTGTNTVTAVELHVTYDAFKLQGVSIVKDAFWPQELVSGTIANGIASIIVGSSPTSPLQGTSTVAVLVFKALTPGIAQIGFADTTQAAGIGEQNNVLQSKIPVTITVINNQTIATPTPTAQPGVTATPTPIPVATSTSGSSTSPFITVSNVSEGQTLNSINPTFIGKALANAKVVVTIDSTPQTITTYADASGNWTTRTVQSLEVGSHKLVATATDNSGQTATVTVNFNIGLPVTASSLPTFTFLSLGFVFFSFGLLRLAF